MPGGMTFRKDCEECGRSYLTPDKKAKYCQRCAANVHSRPQPQKATGKGTSPQAAGKAQQSTEKRSVSGPAKSSEPGVARETAGEGKGRAVTTELQGPSPPLQAKTTGKETPTPERGREPVEATPDQIREIAERYQKYVEVLERPPIGRRKTIAADLGLPYQSVVLGLRQWNQQHTNTEEVTREQRFAIEKIYFSLLEGNDSFPEIKARIVAETGLNPWLVSRYLDLIHDGEKKLQNVPPVSPEQETAILEEYRQYLSASGPPEPPLHTLIAERTGVLPKQVYKVLLAFRLSRFREKWG